VNVLVHTGACLLLVRAGLAHQAGRRSRPDALIAAVGGLTRSAWPAPSPPFPAPHPAILPPTVALASAVLFVVAASRATMWMLATVWELDRSRHLQASLAVAEERLRFSRDLHNVFGRTLSVVALKAELAAQLARRGRAEATDEMLRYAASPKNR
jgi:two-component system sensor histidine kinase DesK